MDEDKFTFYLKYDEDLTEVRLTVGCAEKITPDEFYAALRYFIAHTQHDAEDLFSDKSGIVFVDTEPDMH